jgi:hypothetical protein
MDRDLQQLSDLVAQSDNIQNKRLDECERALSAFSSFTHATESKLEALSQIATTLNRSWALVAEAHKRAFQLTELIVLYADVSSFQSAIHNLLQLEEAIQLLTHVFYHKIYSLIGELSKLWTI